ncbi:P-loop NTPase fold protein [Clostridium sp.]|uniref:KAP family P-loop NTPase fold protein n=1 Tax=Clostridium sp. TaxID=1506 RepID=UPI0032175575
MLKTESNLKSFDDDIYNRKIIAENLTKIISSQEESMVMSLDSAWGTGKTTFITMWKDMLDLDNEYNTKFKTLYFNAWENDYIKDPLLALFSEIQLQLKEEDSNLKQCLDNVKARLKPIAKLGITTSAKILTAGVLDFDKIQLGEQNETELIALAGKLGELSVQEIAASKTVRNNFKKAMNEYQMKSEKKIIFFIDELDRCRPTFAIELLEVIKHLFNIDNCIFVISIDKEQLSHSVSTIYGQNMDTVGYLRRFFDLDYTLPKIDVKQYMDYKNSIIFKDKYNIELFQMFLKEMFILETFSLRDIDKAYYYIRLLLPLVKEFNEDKRYASVYMVSISYLYSILITTKIKNPILYKQILDGQYEVDEIIKTFKLPNLAHYNETLIMGWHNNRLQQAIDPILRMYLSLILRAPKESYIFRVQEDEFTVGLKNKDGEFLWDYKFNLESLFQNKELNIINKLEFIETFSIE